MGGCCFSSARIASRQQIKQKIHQNTGFEHKFSNNSPPNMNQKMRRRESKKNVSDFNALMTFEQLSVKIVSLINSNKNVGTLIAIAPIGSVLQKYLTLYYLDDESIHLFTSIMGYLEETTIKQQYNTSQNSILLTQKFAEDTLKIQNEVYFKHKDTLKVWGSIKNDFIEIQADNSNVNKLYIDLDFNMNFQELSGLAKCLRNLCEWDMNAFLFLSTYLIVSAKNLESKNVDLQIIEKDLVKNLQLLQSIFPPAPPIKRSAASEVIETKIKDIPVDKRKSINLSQYEIHEKILRLEQFIMERAKAATDNYERFIELTKGPCTRRGLHFKTGVKINSHAKKQAIERVKEKIMRKTKSFQQFKKYTVQIWKKSLEFQKDTSLEGYLKQVDQNYEFQMAEILKKIDGQVDFLVTDMLRGKCMFDEIEDINEAALQIIADAELEGYQIIQIDNKLKEITSDLVLKIMIGETVAELQLVVSFNQVQNQFSHKIYQIYRSEFYGELKMLNIFQQKIAFAYFAEVDGMLDKINRISNSEKQEEIFQEKENFINIASYFIKFKQTCKIISTKLELKQNAMATKYLNQINEIIEKRERVNCDKKQSEKIILTHKGKYHEIKHEYDEAILLYKQAKNYLDQGTSDDQKLQQINLLQWLGDSYRLKGNFPEAIENYREILRIYALIHQQNSLEAAAIQIKLGSVYNFQGNNHLALENYNLGQKIHHSLKKTDSLRSASTLNNIGLVYFNEGNYEQALKNYNKCLEIQQKLSGKDYFDCASTLNNIGLVYFHQGKYIESLKYYSRCLQIQENIKGKDSIACADTLNNIGAAYKKQGNYESALKNYSRSLEIQQKIKGKQSIDCATALNNIGVIWSDSGNFDEALRYYHQGLDIQTKVKGKDSIDCATTLNNIGIVYKLQGNNLEALKYYNQCLEIQEKVKGKDSLDCASTYNNIGLVHFNQFHYDAALLNYRKCLTIQERVKGKGSLDSAETLNNIGLVYKEKCDYAQALVNYKACLNIQETILGKDSISCASTFHNLAEMYRKQNQYEQAFQNYQKCLDLKEKYLGKDTIESAATLNNMGLIYFHKCQYNQALQYYNRCLKIQQKIKGKDSIDCAPTLNNIGQVNFYQHNYDEALKNFINCLGIKESIKGQDSFDCASTLNNIATVFKDQRKFESALTNYSRCLQIQQRFKGKDSIECAVTLSNIGDVYQDLQNYSSAIESYEKCLKIEEKHKGRYNLKCAQAYSNIADVLRSQTKFDQALKSYLQSLEIQQQINGKKSPEFAATLNKIALTYEKLGNNEKALEYLELSSTIYEQSVGQDDSRTKNVKENIQLMKQNMSRIGKPSI